MRAHHERYVNGCNTAVNFTEFGVLSQCSKQYGAAISLMLFFSVGCLSMLLNKSGEPACTRQQTPRSTLNSGSMVRWLTVVCAHTRDIKSHAQPQLAYVTRMHADADACTGKRRGCSHSWMRPTRLWKGWMRSMQLR